jgi:hypothetical protein
MKSKSVPAALAAAVLAAASLQVRAQEPGMLGDQTGAPAGPTRPHMSAAVSDALKAVMDAAGTRDWAAAKAALLKARAAKNPSDYDLFEIEVVTGFVAVNTGDHAAALASYKRVIANSLFATAETPADQAATLKNAMILSNEAGDYAGGVTLGEKLAATGAMDVTSAVALAFAYFGAGQYAKAGALAQQAIDAAVAAGVKPDDGAVQIVLKSKAMLH